MRVLPIVCMLAITLNGCLGGLTGHDNVQPTDYLKDTEFKKWVIEIDYVSGHKPSDAAMSMLSQRLKEVANKDSITVQVGNVLPGRATWTDSAIEALEQEHKDHETGGDTVVTWVAYVNGHSSHGDGVLGITYGHDRIVIFDEVINNACDPLNPLALCAFAQQDIESAVLVHEFGHAIGLVARGVPMVNPHEDPEHPRHSNSRSSVMYWAVESAGNLGIFNTIPNKFDANDKLDLCRAGGKGSC